MAKIHAAITGVVGWLPKDVLTNKDLEKMVDTTDEWILSRTGITERRILKGEGLGTSDMGAGAVQALLSKKGLRADEIDLLICATVTPDFPFPATANIISDKVGATNAFSYDINAACSGFLFALFTAAKFIESGTYRKVVVVGADKMSSIIDYTDRRTCIIFGDAAAAVLLEPNAEGNGIMDAILKTDGSGKQYLHTKAGGSVKPPSHETIDAKEHFVFQDGQPVFKAAVKGMSETIKDVMTRNQLSADDIAWVVPHQANLRIINTVASMSEFPMDKVMVNIQKYGNTTAATIPLCLWEWEAQLKKGDNLLLTAFGGGFTWGTIWLRWAY